GIEAAAVQVPDLLVGPVGDHVLQLGRVEEVLAHVGAVLGLEGLVLAVDTFHHAAHQHALLVAGEQRIPARAPDHLEHVPARPAEVALSSWMILPLPRTGPSSRCRLQLITKMRLSRLSRPAMPIAPIDSGSSISPSPQKHQTLRPSVFTMPRSCRYFMNRAWQIAISGPRPIDTV